MAIQERASRFFAELQETICTALEALEGRHGKRFREDRWSYEPGDGAPGEGGGVTRTLGGAAVLERAGVNVAGVRGQLSDKLARRRTAHTAGICRRVPSGPTSRR